MNRARSRTRTSADCAAPRSSREAAALPSIVFEDGSHLFEPSNQELTEVLEEVAARNTKMVQELVLPASAAFIFIGLDPNAEFLRGVVDLDDDGFMVTGPKLETSMAGVFAAGDARQASTKQVASAVGEGKTVSLIARDHLASHDHLRSHRF